jgi:hypothetical protein
MTTETRARFTAFAGTRRIAAGTLAHVAAAVKMASHEKPASPLLIFDDETGRVVDVDLRGTTDDVVGRLVPAAPPTSDDVEPSATTPRGRGRPKLGVVPREVTLLPRHWEWLNAQPGGASVALRKLVDEARRSSVDTDRRRRELAAAYAYMSAMAGDLPNFEEATRALFAEDRERFAMLIERWPADVRDFSSALAFSAR